VGVLVDFCIASVGFPAWLRSLKVGLDKICKFYFLLNQVSPGKSSWLASEGMCPLGFHTPFDMYK